MMKCIYCGEELKEGSLYCPKCGKAVQIVPDYNIYDDDYLNQVLTEESQKISGSRPDRNKKPRPTPEKNYLPGSRNRMRAYFCPVNSWSSNPFQSCQFLRLPGGTGRESTKSRRYQKCNCLL